MNTQRQEITFKEQLQDMIKQLEEQFRESNLNYDDFKNAYEGLKDVQLKLQELLEYAWDIKKDEKFKKLYEKLAGENSSKLIDRLREIGFLYSKNNAFKRSIERQGYRFLEQTRAGKRHDVLYGMLRVFTSLKRDFPLILNEPFKPIYSDEMFKVFIFSFLSGVLGKESEEEKEYSE